MTQRGHCILRVDWIWTERRKTWKYIFY